MHMFVDHDNKNETYYSVQAFLIVVGITSFFFFPAEWRCLDK